MTRAATPSDDAPAHPLALAAKAAKANVLPALLLWAFGSAIVAAYYLWPAARPTFETIAAAKDRYGFAYAAVSTALFAGLIPFAMQGLQRGGRKRWGATYLLFLLGLWAAKGVEVDLLYRLQALMFGDDPSASALVGKTLFDQLVYVPFWAVPSMVVALIWAHGGFSGSNVRRHLRRGWYRRLVLPVMIPNWMVWFPAVTLSYTLPTPLQLPVQNIVLCLWVLMVMFMTHQQNEAGATP